MKSVLISIQPKWCELIASGKKTVEVRKTRPKIDTPFKCYIYCTKPKGKYDYGLCIDRGVCGKLKSVGLLAKCNYEFARRNEMPILSGKVIGEFVCDKINCLDDDSLFFGLDEISNSEIEEYSCLSLDEIFSYKGNKEYIYSWHISDFVIYDKPKELHHFFKPCGDCDKKGTRRCTEELTYCRAKVITRLPQSWCYVELLKGGAE